MPLYLVEKSLVLLLAHETLRDLQQDHLSSGAIARVFVRDTAEDFVHEESVLSLELGVLHHGHHECHVEDL